MKITRRQLKRLIESALLVESFEKQLGFIKGKLEELGIELESFEATPDGDIPNELLNHFSFKGKVSSANAPTPRSVESMKKDGQWSGTIYYGSFDMGSLSEEDQKYIRELLSVDSNPDLKSLMIGGMSIRGPRPGKAFFYFKDKRKVVSSRK